MKKQPRSLSRGFLRENALSIAFFVCFLSFLGGQVVSGLASYNDDQRNHGAPPATLGTYVTSGHFFEAVFENWESEFFQMGAFVLMTIALRQKGSSESKPLAEPSASASRPPGRLPKNAPWPVRRGGWVLTLYRNSLTIALGLLFLGSFVGHALAGSAEESRERRFHGEPAVGVVEYVGSSRFWFESFQNWQSEFLAVGVLIVLSIFLRQEGSPQSKEVWEPHAKTGSD